jgi:1-acyl-sn-glycerol-3-phosphate acyltransferase
LNLGLCWRLTRVFLHICTGLATCALVFPWLGTARRNARVQRWSAELLGICRVSLVQMPGAPVLAHAMVVANHVSWLDIFVINALQPCRFVAKSEIRDWPVLGWLSAKAGTVFLVRSNRRDLRVIFKGLVSALQGGERVAFFPEGTTGQQGALLPFHANLFEAAVDAGATLQPYALSYVDGAGRPHAGVEFLGETTFADSLVLILSGPPIRAQLACLAPIEAAGRHRRALAQEAHDSVAAALAQL